MAVNESGIKRLLDVVARLRGDDGCPWDREQTLQSLKKYLVEECFELIDAIDAGEVEPHLDELGDVLLQVALQSQIRAEEGAFEFDDVANHLADKLIRRHPHVFGDVQVDGADDVVRNWGEIKQKERGGKRCSVIDGVPRSMPPLMRAQKIQERAAKVGFDWDKASDVVAKIEEELVEVREELAVGNSVRLKEELGDLLFSVVNLCRFEGVDAAAALDCATAKFSLRFKKVEKRIEDSCRSMGECTLEELDAEWEAVKRTDRCG